MSRFLWGVAGVSLLCVAASCTGLLGDFSTGPGADGGTDTGGSNDAEPDTVNPGEGGGGHDASPDADAGASGGDSGDGGGGTLSCAIVPADQRILNGDGGAPIAVQQLQLRHASQTNVIVLARTNSAPDLAYGFRSDRLGPPQVVQIAAPPPNSGGGRMLASARSVANDTTFVLASDDSDGLALLYQWPDNQNINASPSTGTEANGYQTATMAATRSHGIFYAVDTATQGVYLDLETPPATPKLTAQLLSMGFTGIGDGTPTYRLSDDSISLVYPESDGFMHQSQYPAGSTSPSGSRTYYAGQMLPLSFLANGTNVDIAAVEMFPDAGSFSLVTGTIPEAQLFTFDPATALKPLPMIFQPSTNACLAVYPGKIAVLLPQTAGMDLYILDVATQTITYSLTGASNLVHGDTEIVQCAMDTSSITAQGLSFDVVWADNTGGAGLQNLVFAPLQCTYQ